jgi:MFS family permease
MHNRTSQVAQGRSVLITSALGLVLFDVTAVIVAMPGITKDLGFAVAGAAWVIDAYSLAFTGALLAAGALADRFGRRRSMLAGNAVFLMASIACGAATDGMLLLAARVVKGVGAAFMVTGAIALVAGVFQDIDQRARAFGIIGVICGVAMALGPTSGGLLASWLGWRWIFYANVPFCFALAFAVPQFVAETKDPHGRSLDPVGVALLTISLGLAIDALLRRDGSLTVRAAGLVGSAATVLLFGNACNRRRGSAGEPTNVERRPGARAADAGRHGLGCDNDCAPSRLCHQHCRLGRNARDDRYGRGVCGTIRPRGIRRLGRHDRRSGFTTSQVLSKRRDSFNDPQRTLQV